MCSRGRPLEEVADLVLDLGAEAAEDRKLDAPVPAGQVALRLRQTADRPGDVARQLPVVELLRPDVEARQLVVALDERLDVPDTAEALLVDAEAPCTNEPCATRVWPRCTRGRARSRSC